ERSRSRHARGAPGRRARPRRRDARACHRGGRRDDGGGCVKPSRRYSASAIADATFRLRELGIFVALLAWIVLFGARAHNYLSIGNWQDIGTDVAMVAVVAVGETMVVLTRNIDLSVGSVVGLTAYISSNTLQHHHHAPVLLIVLIAMGIGTAC